MAAVSASGHIAPAQVEAVSPLPSECGAHITQSGPDYCLGLQVKVLKLFPFCSEAACHLADFQKVQIRQIRTVCWVHLDVGIHGAKGLYSILSVGYVNNTCEYA